MLDDRRPGHFGNGDSTPTVGSEGIAPTQLRYLMGAFTTGVTIVTARHDGADVGMTVNSLTSVSLDPPLVLVCLANGTRTLRAVEGSGRFAVSILGEQHQHISHRFTWPIRNRFDGMALERNAAGLPLPRNRMASLECELTNTWPGGDHTIVVGRVTSGERDEGVRPLVFFSGEYVSLIDAD